MVAVVKQEDSTRAALHQERHERSVCLRRIAVAAGEDEVVGPIVRGLTAAGPNMVESDDLGRCLGTAVGAK